MRAGIDARIRKLEGIMKPSAESIREGVSLYLETGEIPIDEKLKTIVLRIVAFVEATDEMYETEY